MEKGLGQAIPNKMQIINKCTTITNNGNNNNVVYHLAWGKY